MDQYCLSAIFGNIDNDFDLALLAVSGKVYDVVSSFMEEPDATVFVSSESETKIGNYTNLSSFSFLNF